MSSGSVPTTPTRTRWISETWGKFAALALAINVTSLFWPVRGRGMPEDVRFSTLLGTLDGSGWSFHWRGDGIVFISVGLMWVAIALGLFLQLTQRQRTFAFGVAALYGYDQLSMSGRWIVQGSPIVSLAIYGIAISGLAILLAAAVSFLRLPLDP